MINNGKIKENGVLFKYMGIKQNTVMVYYLINTEIRYRGEKMDLELTTKEPIYIQIKRHIEMKIISGILKGGQRMPSVREYANELKVNPNTIQRVYFELENDKLIKTQRGIGKFVTEDKEIINELKKEKSRDIFREFINSTKVIGLNKEEVISLINEMYQEEEDE